jgi:[1-hydroxy-2-(trimethylamino)ethyl]phosphonate dioxygenase
MENVVDSVVELFLIAGRAAYFGEPVSQEEHALQCAELAEKDGADDALVIAALLHDVGHLLHHRGEDIAERGSDAQHELIGQKWLMRRFGPAVAEPVRLHVAAKRFLCATDSSYQAQLSPASQLSLTLQGGPLTPPEIAEFATNPFHAAAVRLRRWDDEAKIPGKAVPPLDHYRARLAGLAITE